MSKKYSEGILPFKIVATDKPLIARGGLILPYEFARAIKLPQVIDRELPPPGSGRGYKPSQFVMPLVLMLHGGGKKLNELRELKDEASLRELLEMENLPASCTVGDWLRRIGEDGKGLCGLAKVERHEVVEVLRRDKRNEYTLDTDATIIESEKEEAKWSYKKEKGYQPLLGFISELGLVIGDEFRDGNIPASAGALDFLEYCEAMMPQGKRIKYYRSDSAAYQAKVINHCFDNEMLFTITADQDRGVKETIRCIKEWKSFEKDREIGETIHTMNNTKEAFRLIVQRWPKMQGELFDPDPYCYHVIATNREETAEEIVQLHNQRGQVENFIKEIKEGFGMEWMPCGESYANAVFFRIGTIAYNLFIAMKLLALPPWYRNFTIQTVRWRLYQVAGAAVRHANQVWLKLKAPLEKIELFCSFRVRCHELAYS
jgi:hypothetical protein